MQEPVLYESHMHTPLCKHALGEPEEYAAVAQERGLKGIIVTCHNPLPDGLAASVRMDPEQFDAYVALVARARAAWAGRIDVRLGLEADYMPGLEPWLQKQLASAEFHHVLGSVHPQLSEYQERYFDGNWQHYQETYFEHLAMAAETGLFDTLAHPDLVKNMSPSHWHQGQVMPAIRRALDRIAAAGTAMELNTSGMLKAIPEMNPSPGILREMHQRGIPVVLGADAHVPHRAADGYETALDLVAAAGYTEINFFLERERQTVAIGMARASLRVVEPAVA